MFYYICITFFLGFAFMVYIMLMVMRTLLKIKDVEIDRLIKEIDKLKKIILNK